MTSQIMDLHSVEPGGAPVIEVPIEPGAAPASASRAHPAALEGAPPLRPLVLEARRRLGRIAGRALLLRKVGWAVGVGAALGACRPLLFPLGETAPLWMGLARAVALTAAGGAAVAVGLVIAGRRQRPSELGAARAIDDAASLAEVVASGFAFERDGRAKPAVLLAREKAAEAARHFDVAAAFPLPRLRPSRRSLGRIARLSLAVTLALAVGAYDRVLLGALLAPPTDDETEAAADLEAAAAAMAARLAPNASKEALDNKASIERDKGEEKGPVSADKLASKAREAVHAARRGDRQGALAKLDELRSGGKQRASRAQSLGATLRQITDALAPPKGAGGAGGAGRPLEPSQKAADALRLLAQKTRSSEAGAGENQESRERTLERLERASEEARRAGGEGGAKNAAENAAAEAARAMSQAAEALGRGDRQAAARLLEEAAKHTEAMERARAEAAAEAAAIAEMLEKSGLLEEAIQMALLGQEGQGQGGAGEKERGEQAGKDGKGGKGGSGQGQGGLKAALAARLAALGISEGKGVGTARGGGSSSQRRAKPREGLEAKGSIRAPSQVTEGERAIQAIRGLGKGSEPPASYREVFPSYDAAVEEGIQDERIPAARRTAVRRYFQSIRPE
jgi:hypothetical protein